MAESLAKIGVMLEQARELTLEAASSASARLMDESTPQPKDIVRMLDGRSERDRLAGMRHVVELMGKGRDASEYFPDVVKNVASTSLETRKLVYTYLVRYAQYFPETALMSINTIQKALGDQSPIIRSLALRVMSSISLPIITPIVSLAIKNHYKDMSPIVRRSVVLAIGKCCEADPSTHESMLNGLLQFLDDKDPSVFGTALLVLQRHFPDRLDLLHRKYRRICRTLTLFDEWTQIMVLEMLVSYGRLYMAGSQSEAVQSNQNEKPADSWLDEKDTRPTDSSNNDLDLLFECMAPLLYNRNGAVVLATVKVYLYLGTPADFVRYRAAGFVVRLLRSDSTVQSLALTNIRELTVERKLAFEPYLESFYVFPTDTVAVARLKIDILIILCNPSNSGKIASELRRYCTSGSTYHAAVVSRSMEALGQITSVTDQVATSVLNWLLQQVCQKHSNLNNVATSEALTAIRILVQKNPDKHMTTLSYLAKALDTGNLTREATATIIWLLGDFCSMNYELAVETLRKHIKGLPKQSPVVRYQLVLLAAKIYGRYLEREKEDNDNENEKETQHKVTDKERNSVPKMYQYALQVAKVDTVWDTRDRARTLEALLESSMGTEIAKLMLEAPKPAPKVDINARNLALGSFSLLAGHPLDRYRSIPDWTNYPLDASEREEIAAAVEPTPQPQSQISYQRSESPYTHAQPNMSSPVNHPRLYSPMGSSRDLRETLSTGNEKPKEQTLDEFFSDIHLNGGSTVNRESSSSENTSSESEDDDSDSEEEEEDDDDDE